MPRPSTLTAVTDEEAGGAELQQWFQGTLDQHHRDLARQMEGQHAVLHQLLSELLAAQGTRGGALLDARSELLQQEPNAETLNSKLSPRQGDSPVSVQMEVSEARVNDKMSAGGNFCAWCFERDPHLSCQVCRSVRYCCEEHLQLHRQFHSAFCAPDDDTGDTPSDPPLCGVSKFDGGEDTAQDSFEEGRDLPRDHRPEAELEEQQRQASKGSASKKLARTRSVLDKLDSSRKKHEDEPLKAFVSGSLDVYMSIIVFLNVLGMIIQSQWAGAIAQATLDGTATAASWDSSTAEIFEISEYTFLGIYIVDLVFRMTVLRKQWAYDPDDGVMYMNIFDGILVLFNMAELLLLPAFSGGDGDGNASFVKVLKLARLAKAFRLIRSAAIFRQLRILLTACIGSIAALFWSIVLLLLMQAIFALVLCQSLHAFVMDDSADYDTRVWVSAKYGDFFKSLYTFFEITYSGGWPNFASPVVWKVSAWYTIPFLVYVTGVVFAMIRVITALFLKETLAAAQNDVDIAMAEKSRAAAMLHEKLGALFEAADPSGDGKIDQGEFEKVFADPLAIRFLSVMDINVKDVRPIFNILDDGDGYVTKKEFCDGIRSLQGPARALDVSLLHGANKTLRLQCEEIKQDILRLTQHLGHAKSNRVSPVK